MTIKIVTDSSSDIPEKLLSTYDIEVVPLSVYFGDEQYYTNEMETATFYQKMSEHEELPRSAAPAPNDFSAVFSKTDVDQPILVIALSEGLSSTYQNAVLGKNMHLENHPNQQIEIINSKSGSPGLALLVINAAKKAQQGESFENIVASTNQLVSKLHTFFMLDTLENVIKGGRLSRFKGAIAKTMNIKLIMKTSIEGKVEVMEKVRGKKRAMKRFIEMIGENGKNFEKQSLFISHSNCQEKAENFIKKIRQHYHFKDIVLQNMGPLIGTYAGEGGIAIAFLNE